MTSSASTWLATPRRRRLATEPTSASSIWANRSATLNRPASGETTTTSLPRLAWTQSVRTGMAVRWSTGTSKKPWIWPECRSTLTMRSAPATVSMSARSLAVMGSRSAALRSWRA